MSNEPCTIDDLEIDLAALASHFQDLGHSISTLKRPVTHGFRLKMSGVVVWVYRHRDMWVFRYWNDVGPGYYDPDDVIIDPAHPDAICQAEEAVRKCQKT